MSAAQGHRPVALRLPPGIYARTEEAARDSETTISLFIAEMVRRYLDAGAPAVLPPLTPFGTQTTIFVDTPLADKIDGAATDGQTVNDLVCAALGHHFDQQDHRHDTLLTEVILPTNTFIRLQQSAAELGVPVPALLARLCGEYMHDPQSHSVVIAMPVSDQPPHRDHYPLGQSITRRFVAVGGLHRAAGLPDDKQSLIARAVQQHINRLPARPVITAAMRARSKTLRL